MTPIVFSDLKALISHFEATTQAGEIISIDGKDGIGKTYLADRLAQALGAGHIEIDNFLERNRGGYVEFIRYANLASCLDEHLLAGSAVVVDGLCMELIWAHLERTPTRRVYIKRMGLPGPYWKDEDDYVSRAVEEVIEEWRRLARFYNELWADLPVFGTGGGHPVEIEILRYHHDQNPHEIADVIYEKLEA